MKNYFFIALFFTGLFFKLGAQTITVDNSTQYQTIDGFGFFGANDVWWHAPEVMWDKDWAEMAINDLGITMWRNEIFPPATPERKQDADWEKQKPVVEGLKAVADSSDVDLKIILTVWSPPASMKWGASFSWAGDQNATRYPDEDIQTNHGGTLNPNMYEEYANYLVDHIKKYEEIGVEVYALSLQNELYFSQSFNSCTYTTFWYCELLNAVVPVIKESYPDVKIFGSENMLHMEGRDENWQWFYHNAVKNNPDAPDNIDVLAVHGYHDGVAPSSGSDLVEMWNNHTEQFTEPMNKPAWMTETSGYVDSWEAGESNPGALGLALDIHAALYYGNIEAWVWWQGSENPGTGNIGLYNLMSGTEVGKKYYASKHFYRFLRPGAVRVDASLPYEDVFVTAYLHPEDNTQTLVIINSAAEEREVEISGDNLPGSFSIYRSSESENCEYVDDYSTGSDLVLPARTLVTLTSEKKVTGLSNKRFSVTPEIKVYPNPYSSGELAIKLNRSINKEVSVSFYSVDGGLVNRFNANAQNGSIKIHPELQPGIYLIGLETADIKTTTLFCVQ